MAMPAPPSGKRWVKPTVSLLYSADDASLASSYCAFYVGALLAAANYSNVKLIPVYPEDDGDPKPNPKPNPKLAFEALFKDNALHVVPPGTGKVVKAPMQWLTHVQPGAGSIAALKASQLVLVCTHPRDVDAAYELLISAFGSVRRSAAKGGARPKAKPKRAARDDDVCIASVNYGVCAAKDLVPKLEADGVKPDLLYGASCMEVGYNEAVRALRPLLPGCFVFRRLAAHQKHCEKFLDLLATTNLDIKFTHDPLNHSWGCVALSSSLSLPTALNAAPTVMEALSDWRVRVVAAAALLEVSDALTAAFAAAQSSASARRAAAGDHPFLRRPSRQPTWRPSAAAVSRLGFQAIVALMGLNVPSKVWEALAPRLLPIRLGAPAVPQSDLKAGRGKYAQIGFQRLLDNVGPYADRMPVTKNLVAIFEGAAAKGEGVPGLSAAEIYERALDGGSETFYSVQRLGRMLLLKGIVGMVVVSFVLAYFLL